MKKLVIFIPFFFVLFSSCDDFSVEPVNRSNRAVFQQLWDIYDQRYGGFVASSLDWDSVYDAYEPLVNENISRKDFFDLMGGMLSNLRDNHVHLIDQGKSHAYWQPITRYYDADVIAGYLTNKRQQYMYTYGKVSPTIGYVHISTFENRYTGYEYFEQILREFGECKGIIIDVRSNSEGSELWARYIAGQFYQQDHAYGYNRVRNGVNHDDFAEPEYQVCPKASSPKTGISLVLLIDASVGSAGEDFTMMMQQIPQLTVIGTTTGGRPGGLPTLGELPNGWMYQVPISAQFTLEGELLLHKGIQPDIDVSEKIEGRDMMLERAIDHLDL